MRKIEKKFEVCLKNLENKFGLNLYYGYFGNCLNDSGSFYRQKNNRTPFDRKVISSNHHLVERGAQPKDHYTEYPNPEKDHV
jgi:hypothetical protein